MLGFTQSPAAGSSISDVARDLLAARTDWRARQGEGRDVASFPSRAALERIVETLAMSWGVLPSGLGKTVWAVLPLEDPPPTRDDEEQDAAPVPPARAHLPSPAGPLARTAAA